MKFYQVHAKKPDDMTFDSTFYISQDNAKCCALNSLEDIIYEKHGRNADIVVKSEAGGNLMSMQDKNDDSVIVYVELQVTHD